MIRKYHTHKLQTNPWHREEEPYNNLETPGRQTKQSHQLSLPHQDDYTTKMDNSFFHNYCYAFNYVHGFNIAQNNISRPLNP